MNQKLFSVFIFSLLFFGSSTSFSQVKICFTIDVDYSDNQRDSVYSEDYWTEKLPSPKGVKGMYTIIKNSSGSVVWSGFIGDGDYSGSVGEGCTSDFTMSGNGIYEVTLTSYGKVFSNNLQVRDRVTDNYKNIIFSTPTISSSGTYVINVPLVQSNKDVFKSYMAAAYSIYRQNLGSKDKYIRIYAGQDEGECGSSGNCYYSSLLRLYLDPNGSDRKFTISHELGHYLGNVSVSNRLIGGNCSELNFSSGTCSSSTHNFHSLETGRCAFVEGFAHFYASSVWNNTSENSAYFNSTTIIGGVSNPVINIEMSGVPFGNQFKTKSMENNCTQSTEVNWSKTSGSTSEYDTNWGGLGVELDWARTFWDMLTDNCGAYGLSMFDITNFIKYTTWDIPQNTSFEHRLNAYNYLDTSANIRGGDVNTCWDYAKYLNGIDHPFTNPDGD